MTIIEKYIFVYTKRTEAPVIIVGVEKAERNIEAIGINLRG
jgi:hypothetical protein